MRGRPRPRRPLPQPLGPLEQLRAGRLPRRLVQLAVGLVLYGVTLAAVIRASLVVGVVGNAVATALCIGSQLGPGPRDGLMTGPHRVTGWPIGPWPSGRWCSCCPRP